VNGEPRRSQPPRSTDAAVLDQAFDRDSLYALRSAVAAHASAAGLPRQRVYDVVSAAHELAANAVRHGAGHGRLRVWADGQSPYLEVSDDGPAKRDGARPAAAEWKREHAHGLWIIDQLADLVGLDRDPAGTTVTVTFTISSPS
jgi:anti-sigma regulatory factor (Ser/Thr protein kinase)